MPNWHGTGFGTVLADFDLDGSLDAAIVNGGIARPAGVPPAADFWAPYAQRNLLFANDGTGKFVDRSSQEPAFCGTPAVWRGLAVGDVDNDGAPDLLATCAGDAPVSSAMSPRGGDIGSWSRRSIRSTAAGPPTAPRSACRRGERRWLGWINPGTSYLCSNDPRAHFGLGAANRVDRIDVRWPDGSDESFPGVGADQAIRLVQGQGRADADKR